MLLVYAPASEYILALKITAGRQKDLDDCAILFPKTKIRTRKQAQQLLDRYISRNFCGMKPCSSGEVSHDYTSQRKIH
jgi:hypothetical protein